MQGTEASPVPPLPPAPELSAECGSLLAGPASLLQPLPEHRMTFEVLWDHPAIRLPSVDSAAAAVRQAEKAAAAAAKMSGKRHARARLKAAATAKKGFTRAAEVYLQLERDVQDGDLWIRVVTLDGVRFVYARSTACRGPTEIVDMISRYVQTKFVNPYRVFILFDRDSTEILMEMDPEMKAADAAEAARLKALLRGQA